MVLILCSVVVFGLSKKRIAFSHLLIVGGWTDYGAFFSQKYTSLCCDCDPYSDLGGMRNPVRLEGFNPGG